MGLSRFRGAGKSVLSRGRSQEQREPDAQKELKGSLDGRWAELGDGGPMLEREAGGRPEGLCEARLGWEILLSR